MKLSTLAVTITLSLASLNVMASSVKFKKVNENIETQACYLAATEGLSAAKTYIIDSDLDYDVFRYSVSCNGRSITGFANKYSKTEESAGTEAKIALVGTNTNVETQLCLDALVIGEATAREKHDFGDKVVLCNSKLLSDFVRSYKYVGVEIRSAVE